MANRTAQRTRLNRIQIFLTASLSLHLIFFGAGYVLLPEWKVERLISTPLELSLLPVLLPPVVEEPPLPKESRPAPIKPVKKEVEKPLPEPVNKTLPEPEEIEKVPDPPQPVAKVSVMEEVERPIPQPAREELPVTKEIEKAPDPPPSAAKEAPKREEAKPISKQAEGEKIIKTPPIAETVVALSREEKPSPRREENPFPVRVASSMTENLSLPVPPSSSSKPSGQPSREITPAPAPQAFIPPPSLPDREILVAKPRYAENPKPTYPREARKKGWEGEVLLRVEVLVTGKVGQVEIKSSSGYELLDQSALSTVRQWKFIPARKGTETIPLWVNIPIRYHLQ